MKRIKRVECAVIALLCSNAAVADFDEGLAAYKNQDYGAALNEWRSLAEKGEATSQYALGELYAKGQGVAQDYRQSIVWFRKAAEQGYAETQNNLGLMYEFGNGVTQNIVAAYALYDVSAMNASSPGNKAVENRDQALRQMSQQEQAAARELVRQMMQPGDLLKALDQATRSQ